MTLYKKLSVILLLITISACSTIQISSRHGQIRPLGTVDKNAFSFTVDDEFIRQYQGSEQDKKHSLLTKMEAKLLIKLLVEGKYCLDSRGNPQFQITSKQERIFDSTYAHMIETSYNAKPITPRTYFGVCTRPVITSYY
jgi:hypothetical protein